MSLVLIIKMCTPNKVSLNIYSFLFIYMYVCLVGFLCTTYIKCPESQRVLDSLTLELEVVVSQCGCTVVCLQEQFALLTALPSPAHSMFSTDTQNKAVCWWGENIGPEAASCYVTCEDRTIRELQELGVCPHSINWPLFELNVIQIINCLCCFPPIQLLFFWPGLTM